MLLLVFFCSWYFCSLQLVLVLYDYCYWYSFSLAMHHLKAMSEHSSRKGKRFRETLTHLSTIILLLSLSFFLLLFLSRVFFLFVCCKATILVLQRANDDGNRGKKKSHTIEYEMDGDYNHIQCSDRSMCIFNVVMSSVFNLMILYRW